MTKEETSLVTTREVLQAYSDWFQRLERYEVGGEIRYASLVTLMFNHIPGNLNHRYVVMIDEADRVYRTFIRHVVRDPRSPSARSKMPMWLVAPDLPVRKWVSTTQWKQLKAVKDTTINDGLHLNGVMLIPQECRMKKTFRMHVDPALKEYRYYVRPDRPLRHIEVTQIDGSVDRVVDYSLKTLKFKISDLDKIVLFPKSMSELEPRPRADSVSRQVS